MSQAEKECETEQVIPIAEMEENLQRAIDDLINESENKSGLITQHVSMIITHLAIAAAALRMKKQQEILEVKANHTFKKF